MAVAAGFVEATCRDVLRGGVCGPQGLDVQELSPLLGRLTLGRVEQCAAEATPRVCLQALLEVAEGFGEGQQRTFIGFRNFDTRELPGPVGWDQLVS